MFTKDACYANGWWICCGGAMCPQLIDEALEVTSGSGWSGIGAESRWTWAQESKLTLKRNRLTYAAEPGHVHLYVQKQAMCEQMCVGPSICVGRLQDWGEVVGSWRDCETSWGGVGRGVCDFCMFEEGYGQAGVRNSSLPSWICMSVAWIWVRTLGPVFSMLTVWGLNSESAHSPEWTEHVCLTVSSLLFFLGPFFSSPSLPSLFLSAPRAFFYPLLCLSAFLLSVPQAFFFIPFFLILSFSLSVTHGLLFSPHLFYFTLSVLPIK